MTSISNFFITLIKLFFALRHPALTSCARALEHKVCCAQREAFGHRHVGDGNVGQANGAATVLAIKMYVKVRELMLVASATSALFFAERILRLPRSVLNLMNYMVFQKEVERAKH